jgi:hypothetical protein
MGVWLLLPACSPTVDLDLVVGLVLLGSQKVQPVLAIVVRELGSRKCAAIAGVGKLLDGVLSPCVLIVEGCHKCTSCLGEKPNAAKAIWAAILIFVATGRLLGPQMWLLGRQKGL